MDQQMKRLLKRLTFLGYCSFQIQSIVTEAIGNNSFSEITSSQRAEVIRRLEMYEQLGSNYLEAYSK
ncbi:hypothetical protein [Acetonema longum]|uniref:Uncharacterized protein n=1 Tax=Acetonema longum DSM 6540 TaxID=1009370 RepID=F7NNH0_9FIRM|nr:hypothetical protein [Acetonema longum]EGO62411.1 hypothetical protein ALO_18305 [Acetonema longum DSM 6540]